MDEIKYEGKNVKEVLAEMKDTSELMVDLAYSAVLFKNREIADEVFELEEKMNFLEYHARIALMLAARNPKEAQQLVGVLQIVDAAEKISNAAKGIARVLIEDIGLPDRMRLPEAEELVMKADITEDSTLSNKTLGELNLETETGVRITAIKRDEEWILDPDRENRLLRGDTIFGEGPEEGVKNVYKKATGEKKETEKEVSKEVEHLAKKIVKMKNISELSVGLGYTAALFNNKDIAGEVRALESEADDLMREVELEVLKSKDLDQVRGFFHIALSCETITDAALEMADAVMRGIEPHPVFKMAVQESNEIITGTEIEGESKLDGIKLGEIKLETKTGMHVIAIRRGEDWIYSPGRETYIKSGDTLISRGSRSGDQRLKEMARKKSSPHN